MTDAAPHRPGRRGFGVTVLGGLATAGLLTAGAGQRWAEATTRSPALRTVGVEGADVAPAVLPLGLVALAAWGAVLVLRRRGRRVVAVVGALAALGAAAAVLLAGDPTGPARALLPEPESAATTAWPAVTGAAALLCAAAFGVAWWRAPRWPEMSTRYDRPEGASPPADRAPRTAADLWKALDEGRDPTV